MPNADLIDLIRSQWAEEDPALDSSGFAIAGRLQLLGKLVTRQVEQTLAELGLQLGAFDVLATLRRHGAPFRMTPTELSRATMLTSGAMTNRLDRLEAAGHVEREADPEDRRGVRVRLTRSGRSLVERAIERRFAADTALIASLSEAERRRLEGPLRKLLCALGRDQPGAAATGEA